MDSGLKDDRTFKHETLRHSTPFGLLKLRPIIVRNCCRTLLSSASSGGHTISWPIIGGLPGSARKLQSASKSVFSLLHENGEPKGHIFKSGVFLSLNAQTFESKSCILNGFNGCCRTVSACLFRLDRVDNTNAKVAILDFYFLLSRTRITRPSNALICRTKR